MPRVRVATQSAAKVKGLVGGAVFGGGTEGASGPTDDRLGAQGTPVAAVGIGQAHFSVYGRLGEWGRLWSAGHAVLAGMLMLFQTAWQPRRGGAVCGRGGMQSWPACSCFFRLHGSREGWVVCGRRGMQFWPACSCLPRLHAWQPRRGGIARGRGMRLRPACSCLFRLHGSLGGVGPSVVGGGMQSWPACSCFFRLHGSREGWVVCGRRGMQFWPACSCLPRLHGSLGGVGSPEVGACGSGRHAHAFSGCMAAREGHGPHHPQA